MRKEFHIILPSLNGWGGFLQEMEEAMLSVLCSHFVPEIKSQEVKERKIRPHLSKTMHEK